MITAWVATIPEDKKLQKLSEQDLGRLVQSFGNDWELIALELNMSRVMIDQAKMAASSPTMKIFNVFNKWKQCQGSSANLITLLNAMMFVNNRCHIDWDLVKKVILG